MFAAAIGAAAPLTFATRALAGLSALAGQDDPGARSAPAGRLADFARTLAGIAEVSSPAATPGTGADTGHGASRLDTLSGAPLPPPPAVSQSPLPPTVEGLRQGYEALRAMR